MPIGRHLAGSPPLGRAKGYGDHDPLDLSNQETVGVPLCKVGRVVKRSIPDVEIEYIGKLDPNGPPIGTNECVLVQMRPVVGIDLEWIVVVQLGKVKPTWHVLHCGT